MRSLKYYVRNTWIFEILLRYLRYDNFVTIK
nr:MAG TPA: hypothetical protein [Caudoviricetes sp.]